MDINTITEKLSLLSYPVGLGGCRAHNENFECCEYNITVFDNKKEPESIHKVNDELVKLHHGSFSETNSGVLRQLEDIKILSDEQWKLRIFLDTIKQKHTQISNSYIQNCLVDAGVCVAKARDGIKISDPFASLWLKCGAYYLADAISLLNSKRPSPTHMLENIRKFEKNRVNEKFSVVHQCLGIERSSMSLLPRMLKSTVGFSDMVEKNDHSKIIGQKYNYLVQNSLISDCYFYLGYTNRNNMIKIKDRLHKSPELIHVLKVAFDAESDPVIIENQSILLLKTVNEIVSLNKNLNL